MNLPLSYKNRMIDLLGEDFEKYFVSFGDMPKRAFHINKKKIGEERLLTISPFNQKKADGRNNCFLFDFDGIGKHPFYHAGMFYVQEPGAMFPVECVDIKPDWNILDMCAAPGGKSSQAVQYLGENGHIVSNEIIPSRCKILTGNFERLGYKNAAALCSSPDKIAQKFGAVFDLVICDAPCSGEGMFRKEPSAIDEWSQKNVKMCAGRQRDILSNAVKCVKPGCYLLYSTCTFSEEENEDNVLWLLSNFPQFELVPVKSSVLSFTAPATPKLGNKSDYARRFYPHLSDGEGQFAALFKNTDFALSKPNTITNSFVKPSKADFMNIRSFLDSLLKDYDIDRFFINKDKLVYTDPDFPVPTDLAYMPGVTVGTFKKGRIEPHHQFFSAFGAEMINKIDLSITDERVFRYLKGESFYADGEKGYCSVLIEGCAVGGGKLVDGYLKNAYPRGLQNI